MRFVGLKIEDKPKDISGMTVAELKAYAELHKIDLGEATKKDDILKILAADSGKE